MLNQQLILYFGQLFGLHVSKNNSKPDNYIEYNMQYPLKSSIISLLELK